MSGTTFRPDAEVLAAMGDVGNGVGPDTGAGADEANWRTLRAQIEGFYATVSTLVPTHPEVRTEVFSARAPDGTEIALHWFTSSEANGAAVVHAHGGGRIAGRVGLFAPYLIDYVARSGVSFLAVEYRLAPEVHGTVPTEDVYVGLRWLLDNAAGLNIDPQRVAVMGDSAGGGLAAGAALLAQEHDIPLAGQLLIYPMLDDRVAAANPALAPLAEWVVSVANIGWDALLGGIRGTSEVSAIAAPARAADFAAFPRSYIEVGELDIFRDQSVEFAGSLWRAGVSPELHVLPGGTHGYDHWAPAVASRDGRWPDGSPSSVLSDPGPDTTDWSNLMRDSSPHLPGGTFALADDFVVTRFGYGAMQLAGPGVMGPPTDPKEAARVLREVVDLGITHIDTSDAYGPYVTNRLIRDTLSPYSPTLHVVTKVGARRGGDGSWPKARSPRELRETVHSNLRNLGREQLDLVNLRLGSPLGPEDGSVEEPLAALIEMQQEGLIRHLGMSNVTADQVREARAMTRIVCVQNLYNLAHRDDDALIDDLAVDGIAFVPFFPLGGFSPLQSAELSAVARLAQTSPLALALAWLLRRSPNILLIPGTSSAAHLRENVAGAARELSEEEYAALNRIGDDAE